MADKSPEFQRLLMQMFFLGRPAPASMWVGLCQDVFAVTPTIVSLTASEPQDAVGYLRQPVVRGTWQMGFNPMRATYEGVTFVNQGTGRWPVLRSWFLVADDQGVEVLVDWGPLRSVRVLMSQDRLVVPLEARWPT
mgnify:FL=1